MYDDFKLKKPFGLQDDKNISELNLYMKPLQFPEWDALRRRVLS